MESKGPDYLRILLEFECSISFKSLDTYQMAIVVWLGFRVGVGNQYHLRVTVQRKES